MVRAASQTSATLKVVDFDAEQKDVILAKLASQNQRKRDKLNKKKQVIEAQITLTKQQAQKHPKTSSKPQFDKKKLKKLERRLDKVEERLAELDRKDSQVDTVV